MVNLNTFLGRVNQFVLNPIIVLMFVVALLTFFWGLVELIRNAGNQENRDTGKRHMLWGIVGMFIMIGVYGIIRLILNTIGVSPNAAPEIIRPLI